jgi:hypothetical protein
MAACTLAGNAGGRFTKRHTKRNADKAKIVTPAHLCQLYNLSRWGEKGRSAMYKPMAKIVTKAKPNTQ